MTRVAREVGTEGQLGGQARVRGRVGHLEGPHRQRQPDGQQPDQPGAEHRPGLHRRRQRRPDQEGHRRGARRGRRARRHRQHDGDDAVVVRRRGDAGRPRGGHGGRAGRPGAGPGRLRYVEGPHRVRELDGVQPDRSGAQHRHGHHRRRQGRPDQEDRHRRPRRDPGAEDHHQHDGRPALVVRRAGDPGGPRGGHRGAAGRPGAGRDVDGTWQRPHRVRERDGREPDPSGARHRGRRHRGDPRRPQPQDRRGRGRRDPGPAGQHQHDDRQPARHDGHQQGAGLAQGQPRPDLRSDAGAPRSRRRRLADHERADPGRLRAARRVLPGHADRRRRRGRGGRRQGRRVRAPHAGQLRLLRGLDADVLPARRDADRHGGGGEADDPGGATCRRAI